jgi:hypothetical protein
MMRRLLVVFAICANVTFACECRGLSVKEASTGAEVIFRGTIMSFRDSPVDFGVPGMLKSTKKLVVFQVTRVWKGEVGETFEMPAAQETTACIGFWPTFLQEGNGLCISHPRNNRQHGILHEYLHSDGVRREV